MKINVSVLILAALIAALVGCDETLQLEWHDAIGQRGAVWTGIENRGTLALINARADTVPHETIGVGDAMDFIITSKLELDTTKSTLVLTTKGKQYDASFVLYDAPFILPGIRNYRASFTPENDSPSGAYNISATLWDSGGARQHLSLGNINLTVEGDTAPPLVVSVSATSDNEDSTIAMPGNTVTLTFTTDEPILIGRSALSFIKADNTAYLGNIRAAPNAVNQYTAQLQITNAMPVGVLRASFILEDASGNRTGAIVKETTLTIVPPPETDPPVISNIAVAADAVPIRLGGVVTLSFSANEALDTANTQAIFTISGEQHAQPVTLVPNTEYRYQTTLTVTDAVPDGTLEEVVINAQDIAGNSERFTQSADLTIEKVAPPLPAVVSITPYRDRNLTKPFTTEVMEGDTVYTKVTFAKELPATIADDPAAQPSIFSAVGAKEFQYRMQPQDAPEDLFQSGDARPSQDNISIICKYLVQREEVGETFLTYAGDKAVSGTPLQVLFFVYTDEIAIAAETITDWSPTDFTGQVYVPKNRELHGLHDRDVAQPLPNVIVTIMAGPRAGERTSTDSNGRYLFPDVAADTLHLRAERARFEPKEVLVHRDQPTALANGDVPNFPGDQQRHPGNILIGQRWPDEVRFILRETLVVHDLLFIDGGTAPPDRHLEGYYGRGLVVIYSNYSTHPLARVTLLGFFAHEIAHAHQDALTNVDGSGDFFSWVDSPEGKAFEEARKKDWEEVGKADYDLIPGYATLWENAAETAAHYWSVDRWGGKPYYGKLEIDAPHRFKWAEEWLPKR